MIEFTAHDLHQKRQEVYKAALKGPVKITHKFHGDYMLVSIPKGFIAKTMEIEREEMTVKLVRSINSASKAFKKFNKKASEIVFPVLGKSQSKHDALIEYIDSEEATSHE